MRIADSIIKERLLHVYWIAGGPCAGKTTITSLLANRYGFAIYPNRHPEYQRRADFSDFPALRIPRPGIDWEWYFGRSVDESVRWLEESIAGGLEFMIVDLLSEPRDNKILIDYNAEPETLLKIASHNRIVCMFAEADLIKRELLYREDHKMILDCIRDNTSDPVAVEEKVALCGIESTRRQRDRALAIGVKIIERRVDTTPDEQLEVVEDHFGLSLA